jgi:prefoldin subunit 5
MMLEKDALEAMMVAFQGSEVFKNLSEAAELHKQAEELRTQVRALKREQDEVKLLKEMLERDLHNAQVDGGRVAASKHTLFTDAKNMFLNSPAISLFRAKIVKNFNQAVTEVVNTGLKASAAYQQLEADGIRITKNAEALSVKLAKAEKKFNSLEKKMNRLSADASQLDADAMVLEGANNG